MARIILSALNAKYIHAAFGLRYLKANMPPDLQAATSIIEFDINQSAWDIVETLLAQDPAIIGFGVYIWNVRETATVVGMLKKLRPALVIVLGGPEVSHETGRQPLVDGADFVVTGEADQAFGELCQKILQGQKPATKVIPSTLPNPGDLTLPYALYTEEDIAHRVVYVEASRGCPFTCEFCLSSLDVPVRQFPLDPMLDAFEGLLERGLRQFKFVDRTFNLNLNISQRILQFFLDRWSPGLFVHFEMIPDRLPPALREIIARFPPGALQFEVGIQSFNPEVATLISRRQNYDRLRDNLTFLREHTGVHVHADLIVGLPGETEESFANGFDQLVALGPQEIQVGILKRLRGTPICRHDADWQMRYNDAPPYEILGNKLIPFERVTRLRRFARHWDLVANSGNFIETTPLLWRDDPSPFHGFMEWSAWLTERVGRAYGVALSRLAGLLFEFLTSKRAIPEATVAPILLRDYQRAGRSDVPPFLRPHLLDSTLGRAERSARLPKRQARHSGVGQALDDGHRIRIATP